MLTGVVVSEHARDRWRERTGPRASDVEAEWRAAQRVADGTDLFDCDECRWYEEDGVVLLRKNVVIVTVLKWRRCSPEQRAGVIEGVSA